MTSLSEKNKSMNEFVEDISQVFDVIRFNIDFLKTFHDWNMSLKDQKSQRMTKRLGQSFLKYFCALDLEDCDVILAILFPLPFLSHYFTA